MECKQKGYLKRQGLGKKTLNQSTFFAGTVTDRVVRDWLADDPYSSPGIMPDMVEQIMIREEKIIEEDYEKGKSSRLKWKDADHKNKILKDCREAVTKIEPSLNKLVLPYEYDVDFSFNAPLTLPHPAGHSETVILRGFMDIIVRRGTDQWAVYDVKHTKDDYYWKKTRGQLSFYDLAVDLMFGAPTFEVGLLQPLCKEPERMFVLEEEDRSILYSHVAGMCNDIWNENFEPDAPISACAFCEVKYACPKFTPKNNGRVDLF
jgi:hypothetical protein